MENAFNDPANVWLMAGALLIAFEAFTAPGLGIFLAGLGALFTGILVKSGIVGTSATGAQFACFFGLTALWAAALWKWLVKFRSNRSNSVVAPFTNVIGQTAIIARGGLTRGFSGQAAWSGTVMTAELDPASLTDYLPEGALVTIRSVTGTTLIVTPQ